MTSISPYVAESLARVWAALHADLRPRLSAADTAYLQRVLLDTDDDLVAHLLAEKLAQASRAPADAPVVDAVHIGSRVRFAIDGQEAVAVLVHGRAESPGFIGAASRYGAALVGLLPGQAILWPHHDHRLVEVRVLVVSPYDRTDKAATPLQARLRCASG